MELLSNVSLKPYNTFGLEAKTRYFAEVSTRGELSDFLLQFPALKVPLLILGGGSNLLFTRDYEGCVLKISTRGIRFEEAEEDTVLVTAEAGEPWDEFVRQCVQQGLGGLENLSLIPGNVGSSPIQNIGAYGVEMKDCFYALEAMHAESRQTRTFDKTLCEFGYRSSVFKHALRGQYIILSVTFRCSRKPKLNTTYGSISAELSRMGIQNPGIAEIAQAVINIRESKLPDPKVTGNAGSFFKNPTISAFEYYRLKNQFDDLVAYNQYDGTFKLAAGWLIEQCGWKGYRRGDAGVHDKQALILVNYGNATGAEIFTLSEEIIGSVREKFGVNLEREVNVI